MRTETLTFVGDGCSADAEADPCPAASPLTLAAAFALAMLPWLTPPSAPGLFTRTERFRFEGVF
jgi:hypothetical protein